MTEEDFETESETTESEPQDVYEKLVEMVGWTVTDKEKENAWNVFLFDTVCFL